MKAIARSSRAWAQWAAPHSITSQGAGTPHSGIDSCAPGSSHGDTRITDTIGEGVPHLALRSHALWRELGAKRGETPQQTADCSSRARRGRCIPPIFRDTIARVTTESPTKSSTPRRPATLSRLQHHRRRIRILRAGGGIPRQPGISAHLDRRNATGEIHDETITTSDATAHGVTVVTARSIRGGASDGGRSTASGSSSRQRDTSTSIASRSTGSTSGDRRPFATTRAISSGTARTPAQLYGIPALDGPREA